MRKQETDQSVGRGWRAICSGRAPARHPREAAPASCASRSLREVDTLRRRRPARHLRACGSQPGSRAPASALAVAVSARLSSGSSPSEALRVRRGGRSALHTSPTVRSITRASIELVASRATDGCVPLGLRARSTDTRICRCSRVRDLPAWVGHRYAWVQPLRSVGSSCEGLSCDHVSRSVTCCDLEQVPAHLDFMYSLALRVALLCYGRTLSHI
jgi:hypothetical protein